jgi:hypothetical protein
LKQTRITERQPRHSAGWVAVAAGLGLELLGLAIYDKTAEFVPRSSRDWLEQGQVLDTFQLPNASEEAPEEPLPE